MAAVRVSHPLHGGGAPRRDRTATLAAIVSFVLGAVLSRLLDDAIPAGAPPDGGRTLAQLAAGPAAPPSTDAGWGTVHVYYGPEKPRDDRGPQWFAQVGQDRIVLDLLGDEGATAAAPGGPHRPGRFFVDLAANDAEAFSNTLALERRGWRGLCIEPNAAYWYGLARRPGCDTVGALVGAPADDADAAAPVRVKFRGVYGGIVGRMNETLANRKQEPDALEETRFTVPFGALLARFRAPRTIDYLSLDVEGSELLVMQGFPFQDYTVRLLTVERPSRELRALLERQGYRFLKDLAWWGETLWAHESTGLSPSHPKVVQIKTEERNR